MMRPSSSRSEHFDDALVRVMLEVEAALARANATAGVIPAEHAAAITAACETARIDPLALHTGALEAATPVPALVRALSAHVGEPASASVHVGATSQDIIDTAWMLIVRRELPAVAADLTDAADTAADLAHEHRDTIMAGRTLLQQALPTTFGAKAAGWLSGLDTASTRIAEVAHTRLAAQLGGGAGTLASLGPHGPAVLTHFAREVGLPEPTVPWHTERSRITDIAGALGGAAATAGKIARDLVLLAQTEVGEAHEHADPRRGGSSTLPHKRNPVAAISALAHTARVPGLVATLFGVAAQHEHERSAGAWQAEWATLAELLRVTGIAVAELVEALDRLEIDTDAMRANLERGGDALVAERVAIALAPALGRVRAHDLVRDAVSQAHTEGAPLADVLAAHPDVAAHLDAITLRELLDPAGYLGSVHTFVDRALEAHRERSA